MTKTKTNSTKTESTPAFIKLGQGKFAIIDHADWPALSKFAWRAVKARRNWYAKATIYKAGVKIDICMHRFIARTRYPLVTHHINYNSLDNRRENLVNMTKKDHHLKHKLNNIQVRYTANPQAFYKQFPVVRPKR